MQAGFTQQQADAITDVLGQCSQALEHRGPVTLSGPDPTGPDGKPIPTDGAGDQYALNVTQGSTFNNQGDTINNGDTFNTTNSTINNNENVVNNTSNTVNNDNSTINNDNSTITNTSVTETYDSTSDIDYDSAHVHGGPVGKVMVNASDTLAYLEDQMADGHVQASAQYNSSQDWKIEVDTIDSGGDKKLRFFGDASDLTNWDNSHEWVLGWTASGSLNVFAWGLVKVDSGDTAGYLGTRFELGGTFASATDIKAYEQTVSHQVRLFIRFSDIGGWNASNKQALVNDQGTVAWVDVGTC